MAHYLNINININKTNKDSHNSKHDKRVYESDDINFISKHVDEEDKKVLTSQNTTLEIMLMLKIS